MERAARIAEVEDLEAGLQRIQQQLDANTTEVASLEHRVLSEEPELKERLVELYKLGGAGYVRLLLNVDDLRSLGRAYRTTAALAHRDRTRVDRRHELVDSLARARATLVERQAKLQAAHADRSRARAALDQAVAAHNGRLTEIDSRRDLNAQLSGELLGVQQKLQKAVGGLGAPGAESIRLSILPFRGALDWPATGKVVTRFGRERGRFGTAIVHNGITIAAREGDPVHALHEGAVGFADLFAGVGNLVILDHGDRAYSLYGHLASMAVTKGDRAAAGQTLGVVGTGPNGAPGLYIELRIDGKPVDPLQWLKRP
jgi:septal ring factor EnvC (AmiA/AmiB activator)